MIITNSTEPISKNFTMNEFYSRSLNRPASHFLDDRLIVAVQHIRDTYGVPVKINSSFRTPEHQALLQSTNPFAAKNSYHCKGMALDITLSKLKEFQADLESKGIMYNWLRSHGISGIGLYETFVHIDTRKADMWYRDNYGQVQVWDKRSGSKKKIISNVLPLGKSVVPGLPPTDKAPGTPAQLEQATEEDSDKPAIWVWAVIGGLIYVFTRRKRR